MAAPEIGSVEALRRSLLGADSVAFNRASTGLYIEKLLVRLGIADAVNARATRHPDGASVMQHLLASGRPGEFGLGAITEIVLFKEQGLRLVGPLPADAQNSPPTSPPPRPRERRAGACRRRRGTGPLPRQPAARRIFADVGIEAATP